MKIFRKEHFGGILYDTETLRFELVSDKIVEADKIIEKELPKRKDILSAPIRAYFEITRECNLSCKHCFVNSGKSAYKGLEQNDIEKILENLEQQGVIDIRFTGGEPTTRKDWFELIKYAKNKEFVVSFNTNAIYDDPYAVAEKLVSANLEQVTVSIDGLESNHDYIRGQGSFKRMMQSVRIMADMGIKLRFNTIITKMNVHEIPQIIEIANGLVTEINFFYMRPVGRGVSQNHLTLDYYEHFESAKETIKLRCKYPKLNIMHFEQSFIERSILHEDSLEHIKQALPYGNTTIGLTCDGGVWPHGYTPYQDKRLLLGNLKQDSLGAIWTTSEKLDALRSWFRDLIERCRGCDEYLIICAGLNFEMEISKLVGDIKNNPFCISKEPAPQLYGKHLKE